MMNPFLYFLLISLCDMTYGLSIPVKGPSAGSLALTDRKDEPGVRMQKRFSIKENIYNDNEIFYSVNITLGGKEFPVQIDTGASDFWIKPPFDVKFTNVTKVQSVLQFAGGAVLGNISFADMTLGPIRVKSQALVHVIEQRNFDNLFNRSIFGILGLSFPQSSQILHDSEQLFGANSTKGRTFLGNVFAQNKSTPNFFTVLLGRQDDLKGPRDGVFTISEYDSQYGNITSQPKLFHPSNKSKNDNALPLWSVPMDKMFVNGKEFKFNKSSVPGLESGKTAMLLDTGFTLSYIPGAAVDFIYKSISGAKFDKKNQLWEVPCENTTQLDFVFGGKNFSIHPLDITRVKTVGHETVCQSTFRAMQPNPALALDGILGVPFMKNVYAAFDFGDKSSKIAPNVPFTSVYFRKVCCGRFREVPSCPEIAEISTFADETPLSRRSGSTTAHAPTTPAAQRQASLPAGQLHREVVEILSGTRASPTRLTVLAGTTFVFMGLCVMGVCMEVRRHMRKRLVAEEGCRFIHEQTG
ncbi:unnamed protein product [Somion occarium]|uniref:Peptidase A1 domain-containing protein n=1 Tax=Somion occarium TaxID=3059160 RepID=A0ABP1DEJ0_9APHY